MERSRGVVAGSAFADVSAKRETAAAKRVRIIGLPQGSNADYIFLRQFIDAALRGQVSFR